MRRPSHYAHTHTAVNIFLGFCCKAGSSCDIKNRQQFYVNMTQYFPCRKTWLSDARIGSQLMAFNCEESLADLLVLSMLGFWMAAGFELSEMIRQHICNTVIYNTLHAWKLCVLDIQTFICAQPPHTHDVERRNKCSIKIFIVYPLLAISWSISFCLFYFVHHVNSLAFQSIGENTYKKTYST